MSRRKVNTLADAANRAAGGRRVVLSVGTLDGAFLAALQRIRQTPAAGNTSTWAPGVTQEGDRGDDGKDTHS